MPELRSHIRSSRWNALLQPLMRGVDILLEPDPARIDPIPPLLAGLIELVFDFAFDSEGAFQEIVERRRHDVSMTDRSVALFACACGKRIE